MVAGGCDCAVLVRFHCSGLNGVCRSEHFFIPFVILVFIACVGIYCICLHGLQNRRRSIKSLLYWENVWKIQGFEMKGDSEYECVLVGLLDLLSQRMNL